MRFKKAHCLFEQSGTFKNEFIKLGVPAYDYDILDDFGQTDFKTDLFKEIEKAYEGEPSVFDTFDQEDVLLAFFPCIRFEDQIQLGFRGTQHSLKKWSTEQKLEYDIKLQRELTALYIYICKLAIIVLRKGLSLMIENPYSTTHYLVKYWCIPATFKDMNRRDRGDYMEKPTQYWFINFEPSYNFLLEPQVVNELRVSSYMPKFEKYGISRQIMRSMISPDYANRFIREFIL